MCVNNMSNPALIAINVATALFGVKTAFDEKYFEKQQTNALITQAKKAEENAAIARQEGLEDARQKKLKSILNMSEQKANIAASNLNVGSQTSLNIVDDEKLNGELEALTTMRDANKRSDSYLETANNLYNKASLTSLKSKINFNKKLFNLGKNLANETVKNIN